MHTFWGRPIRAGTDFAPTGDCRSFDFQTATDYTCRTKKGKQFLLLATCVIGLETWTKCIGGPALRSADAVSCTLLWHVPAGPNTMDSMHGYTTVVLLYVVYQSRIYLHLCNNRLVLWGYAGRLGDSQIAKAPVKGRNGQSSLVASATQWAKAQGGFSLERKNNLVGNGKGAGQGWIEVDAITGSMVLLWRYPRFFCLIDDRHCLDGLVHLRQPYPKLSTLRFQAFSDNLWHFCPYACEVELYKDSPTYTIHRSLKSFNVLDLVRLRCWKAKRNPSSL